jgi:FKBP-type peptidyl-prolyl cis-trans isomerase (trigger factor)
MEMLPEVEEAVYGMDRGTKRIVRATFPLHHPMGQMRGRQRLIEVELVDCKPMCYPPVVDEDVLVGTKSKRIMGESDAA